MYSQELTKKILDNEIKKDSDYVRRCRHAGIPAGDSPEQALMRWLNRAATIEYDEEDGDLAGERWLPSTWWKKQIPES